jgi:3-hydroxy-3-methylglutaryl CoA synthase
MIKGAHRDMMRKTTKASPKEIEADFERRLMPGLIYCQRVGNIMGATTLLSLLSKSNTVILRRRRGLVVSPTDPVAAQSSSLAS